MLASDGGGRNPPAPKTSKKFELNIDSLYKEWASLQRRRPELRNVRLELLSKKAAEGQLGYFMAQNVQNVQAQDVGSAGGRVNTIDLGPTIRLFLPSIKESFHQWEGEGARKAAVPGSRYTTLGRDLTKWTMSIVRHEAAHAINQKQADIGVSDIPVKIREATDKSRLYPSSPNDTTPTWPLSVHEKRFQLINRAIAGYGNEPVMPKIGLPQDILQMLYGSDMNRSG